jgi:16S rRNA G1207 methylase RsmC
VPHYFDASTSPAPADLHEFEVRLADSAARVVSAPGVFSAGRLDLGTAVLLRAEARQTEPRPASGQFLDLGCGWGAIALSMARWAPRATIWAIDTNIRALELTALNARRLGLGNVKTALPDAVPADIGFSLLWSNPPIRIGKPALHQMLGLWLARLVPGAHADLVVQKHLGADSLERWLNTSPDWAVRKLASAKGYRVIRAIRR